MERIRFCRGCGEPFGWELEACSSCGHAVRKRRSRARAARKTPNSWEWLTGRNTRMALLFVAVLGLLWLLSAIPMWLVD